MFISHAIFLIVNGGFDDLEKTGMTFEKTYVNFFGALAKAE